MPSYGVRARRIYYQVLAEAPGGLTQPEVAEAVARVCQSLEVTPFRPSNAKRVLASLINDGLVTRSLLERRWDDPGPRVIYRAVTGVEGLTEALERPQTTRVVGEEWGRITTGYNSSGRRWANLPARLYFKNPGYLFDPRPRERANRLADDGSWENKAIHWVSERGDPIRRWRWADQRALEAEMNLRSKSSAKTA